MSVKLKLVPGWEAVEIDPDGIPWPIDALVLYAFADDGKIVGRISTMQLTVIEGTYIDPEYRSGSLLLRLVREIEKVILDLGKTHALAIASDDSVRDYLSRLGYKDMSVTVHDKDLLAQKKEVA